MEDLIVVATCPGCGLDGGQMLEDVGPPARARCRGCKEPFEPPAEALADARGGA